MGDGLLVVALNTEQRLLCCRGLSFAEPEVVDVAEVEAQEVTMGVAEQHSPIMTTRDARPYSTPAGAPEISVDLPDFLL